MQETLTLLLLNNKGADQPVHPGSLISALVISYLNSKVTIILLFFVGFDMIKPPATPLTNLLLLLIYNARQSYILLGGLSVKEDRKGRNRNALFSRILALCTNYKVNNGSYKDF